MKHPCKFCQRKYTMKDDILVKHLKGGWVTYKNLHVNCQTCLVDFYYAPLNSIAEEPRLFRLNYRVRVRPYSDIDMDLENGRTQLIFHPKQKIYKTRSISFEGVWPETQPKDALALCERLTKLLAFS